MFWIVLSRIWRHWSEILLIVQPEIVVCWHRQGFRQYGAWKGHGQSLGRSRHRSRRTESHPKPESGQSIVGSIADTWGTAHTRHPSLTGYLPKYMRRDWKPPSQSWRTFLNHHIPDLVSIDFFPVPTATVRILSVFLVPFHDGPIF